MRSILSLPIIAIAVGFVVMAGNYAQAGNVAQGEHAFMKCALCHAKDKTNGLGPGLSGVIGRHAESVTVFRCSEAMKNFNIICGPKYTHHFIMPLQQTITSN